VNLKDITVRADGQCILGPWSGNKPNDNLDYQNDPYYSRSSKRIFNHLAASQLRSRKKQNTTRYKECFIGISAGAWQACVCILASDAPSNRVQDSFLSPFYGTMQWC
jgi:hypothetical protein